MTKIALNTCYNSYLFCFPRSAEMAFFSSLFTSLNNNDINYMILNNTLPFPDTDFCNYAAFTDSFSNLVAYAGFGVAFRTLTLLPFSMISLRERMTLSEYSCDTSTKVNLSKTLIFPIS